jgi:YVTN family beta-propeller protein
MGLSISPDGSKLYVAITNAASVCVINTATNTVTDTIAVGHSPDVFGNFISIYPSGVGITPQHMVEAGIDVYPNPVSDNLQIQTEVPIKELEITDITGRLLYTTTAKTINCSSFAKGVYFIKLTTENGKAVKKFVKE